MLNELYSIYRGLEAVGETPEIRHKEIQEPGAGNTTFRIMLDENGQVISVRLMTKEQIQQCWTMGDGNHNKFPAVKVTVPLMPEGHNDYLQWKEEHSRPKEADYREFIECISQKYLTAITHISIWPEYQEKILKKKELLSSSDECESVYELFVRYSKAATGVEILDQTCKSLVELAKQGADMLTLKAICALLLGEKLNDKGEVESEGNHRVTLLLDCFPDDDIDIYASSRVHVSVLSQVLFELESDKAKDVIKGVCSLTGEEAKLVSDKFYNAKLASFMSLILLSKSKGTSGPTIERYGKSGVEAYSMSETLDRELTSGIEFITSDNFKNKTWTKLSTSSLLVVYCKQDWNLSFTPLITGKSEVEDFEDYLDASDSVLALFKGRDVSLDAVVDFIEIIKVNKGNHKVNFSTTANIGQLINAASQWKQACGNTPQFKLLATISKKNKQLSPWSLSPSECVDFSKNQYKKYGSSIKSIMLKKGSRKVLPPPSISFPDIMKLFLGHDNQTLAKRCLQRITGQYLPLLNYCTLGRLQATLPNDCIRVKTNPKNNTQALSAVTLMSVLLYKIRRTKEIYMNDFAFQLGQLCSAMDELHIGYCKNVRGGQIPNTLIGNLTYSMALQSPIKALAVLASRIKPYESWAKKAFENKSWVVKKQGKVVNDKEGKPVEDKAIKNGVYANKWLSDQSDRLFRNISENSQAVTDTYKSELMLGYLAGRPFEQKNTSDNNQGEK